MSFHRTAFVAYSLMVSKSQTSGELAGANDTLGVDAAKEFETGQPTVLDPDVAQRIAALQGANSLAEGTDPNALTPQAGGADPQTEVPAAERVQENSAPPESVSVKFGKPVQPRQPPKVAPSLNGCPACGVRIMDGYRVCPGCKKRLAPPLRTGDGTTVGKRTVPLSLVMVCALATAVLWHLAYGGDSKGRPIVGADPALGQDSASTVQAPQPSGLADAPPYTEALAKEAERAP